ncbi:DUF3795 domain-containing protein [Desulforamulus aquiferis]|uniref:DUF3795 domain-containing protein n=1 Tax=Desulforamulus aquiferis TaxID=1397668 RepID=A0AAW7ZE18_9FIRM|nr:DUF3795 domain-containing protein [Desulforamulus aquiferis]MDO7787683.1 DUF3795 domain-containing protein [Desulforamulus aquiferis]
MNYNDILKHLAPCGLDCNRCAGFEGGEIKELSTRLLELLGNYDRLAKIMSTKTPAFSNFTEFKEILDSFSKGSCGGCRADNCSCPVNCAVRTCFKEKGIDFCFQCQDYPCNKQENPMLRQRWLEKNDRMREIGVTSYYEEQRKLPRY